MRVFYPFLIAACFLAGSVSAQNWTPTQAPTRAWYILAVSADGSKLAAAGDPDIDAVWVSTNAGTTWTSNTIPGIPSSTRIEDLAISATGDNLAAVALDASAIFTSTNYGTTWVSNSVPVEPWSRIASSADGSRLVASGGALLGDVSPIFVSADSGKTWTPANAPVTNWVSVAASANGSNWVTAAELPGVAGSGGGSIYTSTNGGLDWTLMTNAPNLQWISFASSADGTKLLAAVDLGPIYTSTNSGLNWISNSAPVAAWQSVASSADGCTLAAAAVYNDFGGPGFIYTSTNSGATWQSNSVPALNWFRLASSADGAALWAAGQIISSRNGGIYTSQSVPSPKLSISPAGKSLALSWLLPSTNFLLQQNSNLAAADWASLTNAPALDLNDLQEKVFLSSSNHAGFYRLATP